MAVVLILIASGAWIATRSVYFVGTDAEGFVTLYSGLPYSLPGIDLFSTEFTSGVPAQELSPQVRKTVTETLAPLNMTALAHAVEKLTVQVETLTVEVAALIAPLSGPVLLVDDVADTRWTLTVAARALRRQAPPRCSR